MESTTVSNNPTISAISKSFFKDKEDGFVKSQIQALKIIFKNDRYIE